MLQCGLKYPQIFGGAGVFSPAFWTAHAIGSEAASFRNQGNSRLFFYAGAHESDSMVIDMRKIEKAFKMPPTLQLKEIIDQEAGHNEAAWRKHFPEFYEWILLIN